MKKFLAILTSILILTLLSSCDMVTLKEDNTDSANASEQITSEPTAEATPSATPTESDAKDIDTAFPESLSAALNVDDYNVSVDTSISDRVTKNYTAKNSVDCNVSNIKIEGTEITLLATTVQEFINSGWTIISGNKADAVIRPNIYTNATLKNAEGKTVTVYAASDKNNETVFADCIIMRVKSDYSMSGHSTSINETADFLLCGTLSRSSSYAEIVKELGKPKNVYVTEYASGSTRVIFFYSHSHSNLSDISFNFYEKDSAIVMESFVFYLN